MNDLNEFYQLVVDDTPYETKITPKFLRRKTFVPADPKKINAVIPGIIREVFVKKGQAVKTGEKLFIIEAMKMKNKISSTRDGVIKNILVKNGSMVPKGELLLEFE